MCQCNDNLFISRLQLRERHGIEFQKNEFIQT